MSTERSDIQEWDSDEYYRVVRRKGRLVFHHTSDTVTWETTHEEDGLEAPFGTHFCMSDEQFDAMLRAYCQLAEVKIVPKDSK